MTRQPTEARLRPRRRVWLMALPILIVLAAIVYAVWFWRVTPPVTARDRDTGQPVPVVVATVERRDMPIHLDAIGTVQASATVTVRPLVDGSLVAINVHEGQEVHAGDLLAQIDPRLYQAALDNASAKKAQDEAQLANARLDLIRQQKLVANNYTSAQQADTARATVAQFEAQVRQDQAAIDTARTNLGYTTITAPISGRAGIRQVDQGNIVHASDAAGLVVLTRLQPISVIFSLPQQDLPAVARAIGQAATASDPGPVVQAYMQGAAGTADRLLDNGTLTVLDNMVEPTTGTIKLKATFPNANERLWPGGFVSIRLRVDTAKNAVVVPPVAVQRGPRGAYVFVVTPPDQAADAAPATAAPGKGKPDAAASAAGSSAPPARPEAEARAGEARRAASGGVRRQLVTVGYEDEAASVITSGLNGGEQVVIDGASRLSETSKVMIVPPIEGATPATPATSAPGTRRRAPQAG